LENIIKRIVVVERTCLRLLELGLYPGLPTAGLPVRTDNSLTITTLRQYQKEKNRMNLVELIFDTLRNQMLLSIANF